MKRMPTGHRALLIATGAHAALLWPLLAPPDLAPRLVSAPVMTVSLVSPAAASPPPTPAPPAPRLRQQTVPPVAQLKPPPRAVVEPPAVVRTPAPAPAEASPSPAPALASAPATPAVAAQPVAAAPAAQSALPAPPAPSTEASVVEARFDAAYLNNPKPAYPPLARRLGEQGQVLLRAYVSADGRPEQIELRRSSGSARLDAAAQETVRRWRFVPARRGDAAIAAWVLIPINFRLDS